jgi:glutamyl-tRNA reductase
MSAIDPRILDRILVAGRPLDQDDVELLASILDPAWKRRAARLAQRNAAVREALTAYTGWCNDRAAKALLKELRDVASFPHKNGEREELLRRIIQLSGDKIIKVRRITDIMIGLDDA